MKPGMLARWKSADRAIHEEHGWKYRSKPGSIEKEEKRKKRKSLGQPHETLTKEKDQTHPGQASNHQSNGRVSPTRFLLKGRSPRQNKRKSVSQSNGIIQKFISPRSKAAHESDFPYTLSKDKREAKMQVTFTALIESGPNYEALPGILSLVPNEIWVVIFRTVCIDPEPRVVVAALLVCKSWHGAMNDIVLSPLGMQWYRATEDLRMAKYRKRKDYIAQAQTFPDNGTYEGEWVTKIGRHGQGVFTSQKRGRYEGSWFFDKMHGYGVLQSAKGWRYEGFFHRGVRHGRGIEHDKKNGIYEGYFLNNMRNGKGVYECNGRRYEGDWVDGKRCGRGVQTYEDGAVYEGEWSSDVKHGQGVFVYSSGSRYEGSWVDGKEEGWGVLARTNGERYEGEWRRGKRHGKGVLTSPKGTWKGKWANGKFVPKEKKDDDTELPF